MTWMHENQTHFYQADPGKNNLQLFHGLFRFSFNVNGTV